MHSAPVSFVIQVRHPPTDLGHAALAAHRDSVDDFYDRYEQAHWESHAEQIGELAKRVAKLVKSLRRAARRGKLGPATMRKVWSALDEASAKIQSALGEE